MSLIANIEHLHVCAGIEAVAVLSPGLPRSFRGNEQWCQVLDTALRLFTLTSEPSIRMVVGNFTLLIQREGQETVGVVLPTGHAIAKSLRRMIRRMSRKNRSPISQSQMAHKQAETMAHRDIPRPLAHGGPNPMGPGPNPMGPGPNQMGPGPMPQHMQGGMGPMGPMGPGPGMRPPMGPPNMMPPQGHMPGMMPGGMMPPPPPGMVGAPLSGMMGMPHPNHPGMGGGGMMEQQKPRPMAPRDPNHDENGKSIHDGPDHKEGNIHHY